MTRTPIPKSTARLDWTRILGRVASGPSEVRSGPFQVQIEFEGLSIFDARRGHRRIKYFKCPFSHTTVDYVAAYLRRRGAKISIVDLAAAIESKAWYDYSRWCYRSGAVEDEICQLDALQTGSLPVNVRWAILNRMAYEITQEAKFRRHVNIAMLALSLAAFAGILLAWLALSFWLRTVNRDLFLAIFGIALFVAYLWCLTRAGNLQTRYERAVNELELLTEAKLRRCFDKKHSEESADNET